MVYLRNIILLLLIATAVQSQNVSGYVIDSISGETLVGAHIVSSSGCSTITNNYGYFSLPSIKNDTIKITYVGYEKINHVLHKKQSFPIHFRLVPNNDIDEVVISANQNIQNNNHIGLITLPIKTISELPSLGGESDVMKSLQLMPGIRSAGEGQSAFFVRGGSPDQNLVIIDNVPIYYVNHLGGFVSVLNTDALNHVKTYKGGFPANYGGRLSSITDIQTKDGNYNEHKQKLTIGLITSKALFEGPIIKDTFTYMISARRFMYDILSRPYTYITANKKQSGYTFYDINAKVNYKPNSKNRFFLSCYTGQDKMLSKRNDKTENTFMNNSSKWGNLTTSMRWNHIFNNNLFSSVTAYYSQYAYKSVYDYQYTDENQTVNSSSNFNSQINDVSLNPNFEYYATQWLGVSFGLNSTYHTYKPNHYQFYDNELDNIPIQNTSESTFENAGYLQFNINPISVLNMSIGYRAVNYATVDKNYISHEPRILVHFNLQNYFSIKGAYSKMTQFTHLLTWFGTSIPADLWVPSNSSIPPQNAEQLSAGIFKSLSAYNIELGIEAYYKQMNNLIEYRQGYNLFATNNWVNAVEAGGNGYGKGIEFIVKKKSEIFNGWISYTLSESKRQFDNINNGYPYYYTYDATHDLSLVCSYKLNSKLTLSGTWVYQTGRAITVPNQHYLSHHITINPYDSRTPPNVTTSIIGSYDEKNNIRMAPYHRLDISLTYKTFKKKSNRELSIGLYNVYNRQNAIYYYVGNKETIEKDGKKSTTKVVYQVSMFPLIPSISYSWQW